MLELFMNFDSWLVVLTTILVVMLCVVLHYEVLSSCGVLLGRIGRNRRSRILLLISMIPVSHVAQRHWRAD